MLKPSTVIGIFKVGKQTAPFYAADIGVESWTMSALSQMGAVRKTGNFRESFVQLWGDHYKKVKVYEWENTIGSYELGLIDEAVEEARELIALVESRQDWDK